MELFLFAAHTLRLCTPEIFSQATKLQISFQMSETVMARAEVSSRENR